MCARFADVVTVCLQCNLDLDLRSTVPKAELLVSLSKREPSISE